MIFYNNDYSNYINESINDINIMEETYKLLYESQLEYNKIFIECGITEGYLLESEGSFKERIKELIKRFIEWLKKLKDKIKSLYNKIKSKFRIQELEYEKAVKQWDMMITNTHNKFTMEEFKANYIDPFNLNLCMSSIKLVLDILFKLHDDTSIRIFNKKLPTLDYNIKEEIFDKIYAGFHPYKSRGMKEFSNDSELISSIKEFVTTKKEITITKDEVSKIIKNEFEWFSNEYNDKLFNRIDNCIDEIIKNLNDREKHHEDDSEELKTISRYSNIIKRISTLSVSLFNIYSETKILIRANDTAILNKAIQNLDKESKKVIKNNLKNSK